MATRERREGGGASGSFSGNEFIAKNKALMPGDVSETFFRVLVELSALHSEKIINALHDYLVSGDSRKDSCERYGASISYFSVALGRLFYVNQLVSQLVPYYYDNIYAYKEEKAQ